MSERANLNSLEKLSLFLDQVSDKNKEINEGAQFQGVGVVLRDSHTGKYDNALDGEFRACISSGQKRANIRGVQKMLLGSRPYNSHCKYFEPRAFGRSGANMTRRLDLTFLLEQQKNRGE